MRKSLILFLSLLTLMICSCRNSNTYSIEEMPAPNGLIVALADFEIEGDTALFHPEWVEHHKEPGVLEIELTLKSQKLEVPKHFRLSFSFPSVDIVQYWNPGNRMDKVNYYYNSIQSRASANAPVLSFVNSGNRNRMTIAVSDALNKVSISSELIEEDSRFHIDIDLLDEHLPAIQEYKVLVRLDNRNIHFNESLREVSEWWASFPEYKPASVPEYAKRPMYSTWYSFHQSLDVPKILSELREAKKMGMTAIIVDDGWQTMDSNRGYAYTGDWEPLRIPNMEGFVDSVHQLDMKFLLWYSLPFVGKNSDNYKRFKGKYLWYWESQGTWVLDPRYPEVREFIIGTYETAMREWGLDGFKLDFLGFFKASQETDLSARNGRDIASVNLAVDVLMTDIMSRLKEMNPDVMIEFRQPYIGPLMRKYGNMFRASDCPNMAIVNRVRTTDLRLLSGNTAVHSDMFMWHKDDPVESAALQILNIIYSVPQLSVILKDLTDEQLSMAKYYIDYWNKNRDVLLDGGFIANDPGLLYPVLRSSKGDKEIITVYSEAFVTVKQLYKETDIINAKTGSEILLNFKENEGRCSIEIFNCQGQLVNNYSKTLSGACYFAVPASGMIKICKKCKN